MRAAFSALGAMALENIKSFWLRSAKMGLLQLRVARPIIAIPDPPRLIEGSNGKFASRQHSPLIPIHAQ
jgi:hypothetical protein